MTTNDHRRHREHATGRPLLGLAQWLRDEKLRCETLATAARCPLVAATSRQRAALCGTAAVGVERLLAVRGIDAPHGPRRAARWTAHALGVLARRSAPLAKRLGSRFGAEARVSARIEAASDPSTSGISEDERYAMQRISAIASILHVPQHAATSGGPEC